MKGLKKMNIGLLLAIITVILVVAYCVHVENERKKEKVNIEQACEDFIAITDKYSVLPSEYQNIGIKSTDVDLSGYKKEMKTEIEKKAVSTGVADIEEVILSQVVENQLLDTSSIITEAKRAIVKISSIQFSGNEATVIFNSRLYVNEKYNDINPENGETTEKVRKVYYDMQGDTITLEKVGNEWKIVYSNLQFLNSNPSVNYYM